MDQTERTAETEKTEKENHQQMVDLGAATVKNQHGTVYILTLVGQIEGHQVLPDNAKSTKYEHVLPLLAAMEEAEDIDGILILLNTVGGDIEAGLAIAELIAGMKKPTVSLVLGGGHSIGVPLAVSARVSMIVPSAKRRFRKISYSFIYYRSLCRGVYYGQIQRTQLDCHNRVRLNFTTGRQLAIHQQITFR